MDREQLDHLQNDALHGWEIVDSAARLGVMNLYLHGIGGDEHQHHRGRQPALAAQATTTTWC